MTTFIERHFPTTKADWKKFSVIFLPIIFSTTMIALNGMIDNFMVGHINQGTTALGAVNSWTNIYTGLVLATSAAGSITLSQFYHAKQYKTVKQIVRIRYMINILGALILIVMTFTCQKWMIGQFMNKPVESESTVKGSNDWANYQTGMDNASEYIRITCFQWLIYAVSYDIGSQLRELGHARITLYVSILMLGYHISLNAILLYGFDIKIIGPAIAGATSRFIPLIGLTIYAIRKKVPITILPWTIFAISKKAVILMLQRYIYFISVFTVVFFITYRNHFYDTGYPQGKLGDGIQGIAVLALTGAIMNVFTTTFAAAPAMAANFVASELGKGNLKQAKINSDKIKGFNTSIAFLLDILLLLFSLVVPHMTFLVAANDGAGGKFDNKQFLLQVSHSTAVITFFYPIWIWFVSSYRNSQAGGKGGFMAIWDWVISGPVQLGWLALLAYVIIPASPYMQSHFWATYFIFFTSDLLKLVGMEIYYYKYKWIHSLTAHEREENEAYVVDLDEQNNGKQKGEKSQASPSEKVKE